MYVALPVVKKLPVDLIGNISRKNKNIKGIIMLFAFELKFEIPFLRLSKKALKKIIISKTKPIMPNSDKISK